jgi:AraC-like DNA-binding protein
MKYWVEADVIALFKNLTAALEPFARAQQVSLQFHAEPEELRLRYHPEEITLALTTLLCWVITFTPQGETVTLQLQVVQTAQSFCLNVQVQNSGADLSRIGEITKHCKFPVKIYTPEERGTIYELRWELERQPNYSNENLYPNANIPPQIRGFYAEIRKRLRSHFTQIEHKISALAAKNPQDAVFLQKINALILANLDQEDFDAMQLSRSLAMSRTQLFRRLKSLLQESPAHYIRCFRLQKAKEMLETTDDTVGEVAFKTGFQSQSHFTRVFIKQYGVRPSAFRRTQKESHK